MSTWASRVSSAATLANAITVSRILFFAICIRELVLGRPGIAIIFFIIAWGLDAIDGVVARRMGQASVLGSQLDKAIDRIIMIGTIVALLRYGYLPHIAVFLLVKDAGLSVALTAKKTGKAFPSAGWLGKITSLLQGAAVVWLFLGLPGQSFVVTGVGLLGGYVAIDYLRKL